MLVGRDTERARLGALLEDAKDGRAGAVLLTGEPGIGKSALAADARRRAAAEGLLVVHATGIEDSADVPFGALADLAEPLLAYRDRLAAPQAEALDAALALRPPAGSERFAVPSAVLALLSAAAEEQPVLLVVDDVQWLDAASASVLVFVARRLRDDGVAVLFAGRTGEAPAFEAPGIDVVEVVALEEGAARSLAETAGDLAPTVVELIVTTAGGNPLALTELPALLSRDQRAGRAAIAQPLMPGAGVQEAFRGQLAALPPDSRRAVLVAAADPTLGLDVLARALAAEDLALDALEPAEAAGLVSFDAARVAFRHPLLRSAAYHLATGDERRATHRALATALGERDPAHAWHLAAAADGADEEIAMTLEGAALAARERGGSSSAALAFARAAELTPDPSRRAARLVEAGRDHVTDGNLSAAIAPLEQAAAMADTPTLLADAERILANAVIRLGDPEGGLARLAAASEAVAEHDTRRAAGMALEAAPARMMIGDFAGVAEAGRRAAELAGDDEHLAHLARLAEGTGLAGLGRIDEARPLLAGTVDAVVPETTGPDPIGISILASHALLFVEDHLESLRAVERIIEIGRRRSAPGLLIYPLVVRATGELREGRLAEAAADAEEAATLADATMALSLSCVARATLAGAEAARGREEECRAAAAAALDLAPWVRGEPSAALAHAALGQLELSLERFEQAPRLFAAAVDGAARLPLGETVVPRTADQLEAAYEVDDHATVAEARRRLDEQAAANPGSGWAETGAARARALAADDYDAGAFAAAVRAAERLGVRLEISRTLLLQGERARWHNHPTEAREPLLAALAGFERIGAAQWARRAREELRTLGATVAPTVDQVLDVLNPHEVQVARLVSKGMTNREAAAALFLSPKTIEYHLRAIYKKLSISSRTELAGMVSKESAGAGR